MATPESLAAADQALFDRIASEYASKDLRPYCRAARKQRLLQTCAGLTQPLGNILEVGCGAGFSAEYLSGRYTSYTGIDYSTQLVDFARERHGAENVFFFDTNVDDFRPESPFDTILMIGVLHHMPEPEKTLVRVRDWIAKDGSLVVNEPQRGTPVVGLLRALRKRIDPKYSADQVEFSERELVLLFRRAGYLPHTHPQGLLSTPIAETQILPDPLGLPLSKLATALDPGLERLIDNNFLRRLAWNVVVQAQPLARVDAEAREGTEDLADTEGA